MADYEVVLGLQSTADWASSDYIPGSWREMILRQDPNGETPLLAMTSKLPSEAVTDYQFHWWTEGLPVQGGALTDVYAEPTLTTAYVEGNGDAGDVLYVKLAAAVAKEFRTGHTAMLRDNSDYAADLVGKVTLVVINGASSYIGLRLLEDDDGSSGHAFDYINVIGSVHAQGSESPDSISYQPMPWDNYTQIFWTTLEITGTVLSQKTRIGDWYQHEKSNCLRRHMIEMEKAFLWGVKYLGTGTNGKPEYTTQGLIRSITTNRFLYTTDTDYAGKTWLQGGADWLNNKLATVFKYGGDSRMAYAGIGAINGINKLAEQLGNVQIKVGQAEYGIKVLTYMFPFGEIYLKRHPLFSYETANQNSIVLFEPKNLKYRYLQNRDTHFRPDDRLKKGTWTDRDAIKEGYLTEAGLEYYFEPTMAYLNGVGLDNTV